MMLFPDRCSLSRVVLAVVVGTCLVPPRATAQTSGSITSEERDLLARLASVDYHQRQRATERLLQDHMGALSQIQRLYQAAAVQEQRHRLMDVAFHYAMRDAAQVQGPGRGSGFIGIEMVPGLSDARNAPEAEAFDAVVVVRTFPGFPGHANLRAADLILSVNDARIDHESFTQRVGKIRPGQLVTLTLQRDGRTQRVRFPIGDRAALSRLYGPDGEVLAATRLRLDRVRAMLTGQMDRQEIPAVGRRGPPLPVDAASPQAEDPARD